ncbi:MAG: TadE/TadG family type IV pilus assembly protein [Acidimicrobiales bacterium]
MLEAAVVTPVFLVLLLGVIEGGLLFYERLSVANMSLAGARSASAQGTDILADLQVLRTIGSGASGPNSQIRSVVVYRATSPTDRVPVGCKTASVLNSCNRYVAADLAKDTTQFGCVGPPGPTTKIDSYWCPNTRKTALSGAQGPPDYIGVYVEAAHEDMTGIFGRTVTLRTDTIIRMEPRTLT